MQDRDQKLIIWVLCYVGIVSRHMCTETWNMVRKSQAKENLNSSFGISKTWLGCIDSSFMLTSAVGNIFLGPLVDRYPQRAVILVFTLLSSLVYLLISYLGSVSLKSSEVYLILMLLQGALQSPIYPGFVSLICEKFPGAKAKSLSFLSTSVCFGNFLGAYLTGLQLSIGLTWETSMFLYSSFMLFNGFLIFISAKPGSPSKASPDPLLSKFQEEPAVKKPLPIWEVLEIPNFKYLIFCKMCVKFLYYSLNMWTPFYLSTIITDSTWIGGISGSLEVGGMIGAVLGGSLFDILKSCGLVLQIYLLAAVPLVFFLVFGVTSYPAYLLVIFFIIGVSIGGSNLILITSVPGHLSDHPSLRNFEVVGSITSMLDASGSLGAGVGMLAVGYLVMFSWSLFLVLILSCLAVAICLLFPITISEQTQAPFIN